MKVAVTYCCAVVVLATAALEARTPQSRGRVRYSAGCDTSRHAAGVPVALEREVHRTIERYGGLLLRWPDDRRVLRVWVQPHFVHDAVGLPGAPRSHDPSSPLEVLAHDAEDRAWERAVLEAAHEWRAPDVGLAMEHTMDSAGAEVRVLRVPFDSARGQRSGVLADRAGRIHEAWIALGEVDARGRPYRLRDVRAAAAHEVGHVLGLGHRETHESVMTPDVRADAVASSDRALLRAWYAHAPGRTCPTAVPAG